MFHLVYKPLTTSSFLLVDVLRLSVPALFMLPLSSFPHPFSLCLCLSLIPMLCSMLLGDELTLFQFYMLATLPVGLPILLHPLFIPSPAKPLQFSNGFLQTFLLEG